MFFVNFTGFQKATVDKFSFVHIDITIIFSVSKWFRPKFFFILVSHVPLIVDCGVHYTVTMRSN